jgi:hypothetical protein
MLHDWEIARAATELARTMPDLCDIYRRSGGDGFGGGGSDFGDPHAEGVAVSVEPLAVGPFKDHVGSAGREFTDEVQFELAFPLGTDVEDGDMIDVSSMGDAQITVRMVEHPESWDMMVKAQGTLTR